MLATSSDFSVQATTSPVRSRILEKCTPLELLTNRRVLSRQGKGCPRSARHSSLYLLTRRTRTSPARSRPLKTSTMPLAVDKTDEYPLGKKEDNREVERTTRNKIERRRKKTASPARLKILEKTSALLHLPTKIEYTREVERTTRNKIKRKLIPQEMSAPLEIRQKKDCFPHKIKDIREVHATPVFQLLIKQTSTSPSTTRILENSSAALQLPHKIKDTREVPSAPRSILRKELPANHTYTPASRVVPPIRCEAPSILGIAARRGQSEGKEDARLECGRGGNITILGEKARTDVSLKEDLCRQ